ncbi:AsmA family protein [Steroidobacter sp. S1-65]|uniref:AsmA family protein n=1 Tax=Steroidobacter gossypii TaxID=2805490 RepID=A0ABS1WS00_9GAMM|nr:AsmA family protein [Steroidobacter gossypii]MBM0103753.1 AsmA family protein [Steroidobacter gossypii]
MRALKIAGIVVGSIVALIVVALLAVLLFVDPNDYRDDIERIVESKTGRQLTLSGELNLSIFPWLALEAGPASLGEAPGFGDEPFVAIQEARVGVRLLPLIRGKVEVGNVRLAGARIRLVTDETGRNNWADLGEQQEQAQPAPTEETTMEVPTIAGLEIEDAAVTIENRQEKTRQVVRDFNLKTGRLASGEPFELSTDFVLDQEPSLSAKVRLSATVTADLEANAHRLAQPEIDVTLTGQGYPQEGIPVQIRADALTADVGKELYRLEALNVTTSWKGEGFPAAGVPIALQAKDLNANLAAQTMELSGLTMDVAGARLTGALTGKEILDAPALTGPLKLEQVSLREWAPKLGVELPATADPKVFEKLNFSGRVAMTKSSAEVGDIVLQLDDTTAKGMLGIADFDAMALRFDLNVDRIDADRYLPPPSEEPAGKPAEQPAADQPPTPIPVETLRNLNARGQLQVGEAIFAGIKFTKLRLGVNARDGKVRFNPSEASMYGGNYSGDIGIDATGSVARVTLDEHVSGIDFAPLFKDFFETDRVSGKGSANIKLAGSGKDTDEIVKTLTGNIDFKVADGAIEGTDLWWEIRRARALLKQQPAPERSVPVRTPFTALTGSGVMKNGVLSNNDLNVAMQYLKITGQGTVDVPASALDYRLVATVMKIPREGADTEQVQDLVDAQIPVKITGALSDPKVRPDLEGYLKNEVKQRVDQEKEKLEEKVKEKLGDKLKDLFNR